MQKNKLVSSDNSLPFFGGFTLIELSLVILITGLLLAPLFQLYHTYQIEEATRKTKDRIFTDKNGIAIFNPLRLPCPADRSLPPNDPNYGFEICDMTVIPDCDPAVIQGICQTDGSRDADGNGTIDKIVIGGVPLRSAAGGVTRNLPLIKGDDLLDGWNHRLTYAVSAILMNPARVSALNDFKLGSISAVSESGTPTAGINNDGQFVVLSHGVGGRGAFTREGGFIPCPAGTVESENCDNDSTFVQAIGNYEGTGATYYDDLSYFYTEAGGDLWVPLSDAAGNPTNHITNLNANNVGIRTVTPTNKLDVTGRLTADTLRADRYCDSAGANCISATDFVANASFSCPANKTPSQIKDGGFVCVAPSLSLPSGYDGAACAGTGNWIRGILSNGCVICTDGSIQC